MSYSLEELQALKAAFDSIPKTDAETEAFMADVDSGKYDAAIAESQARYPTEKLIEELKAKRDELRQEDGRKEGMDEPNKEITPRVNALQRSMSGERLSKRFVKMRLLARDLEREVEVLRVAIGKNDALLERIANEATRR